METKLTILNTHLKDSSPFYLGFNINEEFANVISEYAYDKIFLVTDKKLSHLFGEDLQRTFAGLNYKLLIISGKEADKNIFTLNSLCEDLINSGVTKESIIVAFGGGVVGNVTGLAAALIYRGVKFIEMPTTFMNQTDGTLSNKQAVNGRTNKNLFGCYYAPIFIWTDTKYVFGESKSRIKCGLVESIKNGLIEDKSFLTKIDEYLAGDLKNPQKLKEIILLSILSKLEILKKDPSEKKYGMILEYGHTFGHAIEKLSSGNKPHGECVAMGMIIAAKISHKLGLMSSEALKLHYEFLKDKLRLDLRVPSFISTEMIWQTILSDNKKTGRGIRYVLLEDVNKIYNPDGDFMTSIDTNLVIEALNEYIDEMKNYDYQEAEDEEPCAGASLPINTI